MSTKYGYLVIAVLSVAVVTFFATPLGGGWGFPSAQPRALTVFRMQEGLAVVPAQ
jgi:hypothetical protein